MEMLKIFSYLLFILSGLSVKAHVNKRLKFLILSRTVSFVDKSMLLKRVFESENRILITVPKQFGKTTSLEMISDFLKVKEDPKLALKAQETFHKLNIYKNEPTFFNTHFGKHRVVSINLECHGRITSFMDALRVVKNALIKIYKKHNYLIDSAVLNNFERESVRKWCYNETDFPLNKIHSGFQELISLLRKHFKQKIVLLIDNYDCIMNKALFRVESSDDYQNIVNFFEKMFCSLLRNNSNISQAIVIGISDMTMCAFSKLRDLKVFKFLDDHPLNEFYTFKIDEVNDLFNKSSPKGLFFIDRKYKTMRRCTTAERDEAHVMYGGYVSKSRQTYYNMGSVRKFLRSSYPILFMTATEYVRDLFSMYRFPVLQEKFDILRKFECINVTFYNRSFVSGALKLREMFFTLNHSLKAEPDPDLFFTHFLELGLLTYNLTQETKRNSDPFPTYCLQFPNDEIEEVYYDELDRYYKYPEDSSGSF